MTTLDAPPVWGERLGDGEHSILSPSNGNVWVNCVGSIALCAALPKRHVSNNEEADEGRAAHEFGALSVASIARRLSPPSVGETASNGYVLDEEMYQAMIIYVRECERIMDITGIRSGQFFGLETMIRCTRIHDRCFGTPDFWVYDPETCTVYVRDYKHGRKPVDAWECWQLIIYAAGIVGLLGSPMGLRFDLGIVQPRSFHEDGIVRVWKPTAAEIAKKWDQARRAASLALSDDPQCRPGPWCYKCPGRLSCRAMAQDAGAIQDYMESATPINMTPAEIAMEYVLLSRAMKMLKYRLDACEEEIASHYLSGASMPAVACSRGSGREKWSVPDAQAAALGDMYKVNIRKPVPVLTPKQAVASGIPRDALKGFTETPSSGIKITEAANAGLVFARNPTP